MFYFGNPQLFHLNRGWEWCSYWSPLGTSQGIQNYHHGVQNNQLRTISVGSALKGFHVESCGNRGVYEIWGKHMQNACHLMPSARQTWIMRNKRQYILEYTVHGGSKGAHPAPPRVLILSFWHTNFTKRSRVRNWHPSLRGGRLLREILDPPLKYINVVSVYFVSWLLQILNFKWAVNFVTIESRVESIVMNFNTTVK